MADPSPGPLEKLWLRGRISRERFYVIRDQFPGFQAADLLDLTKIVIETGGAADMEALWKLFDIHVNAISQHFSPNCYLAKIRCSKPINPDS